MLKRGYVRLGLLGVRGRGLVRVIRRAWRRVFLRAFGAVLEVGVVYAPAFVVYFRHFISMGLYWYPQGVIKNELEVLRHLLRE